MSRQIRENSPFRRIMSIFISAAGVIILFYFGMAAYHFGMEVFSGEGVNEYPGTDVTVEVKEGTSLSELGSQLEDYGIIRDSTVFSFQSFIYDVHSVKPGTYTFNTSQSGDRILETISDGPAEQETQQEQS